MARIMTPKGKNVRRFGVNIYGNPKYDQLLDRRSEPPGQHGARRRKVSNYGLQLVEKQKLKNTYGLLEKQFRRTYQRAQRMQGVTGDNLLQLLETRLDNVLFRAGLAATRAQARQLVNHGHILLNGRKTDIPSCRLRVGDAIQVRTREKSQDLVRRCIPLRPRFEQVAWLQTDADQLSCKVKALPEGSAVDAAANVQLVIEHYSR